MQNDTELFDVHALCVTSDATLLDAITVLNDVGRGIVLVYTGEMKLVGTITDADIRKGLAANVTLASPVGAVMSTNPTTIDPSVNRHDLLNEFKRTKLRALPEVDIDGRIVGCSFIETVIEVQTTHPTLMIMAGGFGKRLGGLTKDMPKPLLEVRGKPMLQHIIEMAHSEGLDDIVISTYHMGDMIQDYFGDGSQFGVNITYVEETKPLGTGGSFGLLEDVAGPIIVTNADIMSKVGYRQLLEFHLTHDAAATMAVREYEIQNPFGVVLNDGIKLIGLDEKPIWRTNINAGIYVLNAALRRFVNDDEPIGMPDLIERARCAGEVVTIYPLYENWTDLGSEAEYSLHR